MPRMPMSTHASSFPVIAPAMARRPQRATYRRQAYWVQTRHFLFVLPLLIYLLVFYLYPVVAMLARSIQGDGLTLEHFESLFESRVHVQIFWETVKLAVVTTVVSLVLAYPLAYSIARASKFRAGVMLTLVLVPFWTSILVRSYAWMVLFGRQGIVNSLLLWSSLADQPVEILYTRFAVYVAMVHVLLPFMVLPLYSVLRGIDGNLLKAAEGLGASPYRVFRHIVFPLSVPGVAAGGLLVFILALGFYITPALIGGPRDMTVAMLIAQQLDMYDWNSAAALSAVLLGFALVVFAVFDRAIGIDNLFRRS
jgi:ABC-type spermidine/putrescine transport system permease subunit I